jgi:hypothetical protein
LQILIITILLLVAFPLISRFVGGCLSLLFWLVVVAVVVGMVGAMSN